MKRLTIILVIALLVAPWIGAQSLSLAEQADSAYNADDYTRAIELYRQAMDTDGVSPMIYYNLGNAYYRAGELGRAVISYERALRLDPSNADARANLDFVNSRIDDKPESNNSFLTGLYYRIMSLTTPNTWACTALVLFLLVLGAVAVYVFSPAVVLRKAGFFGGIVLLGLMVFVMFLAADSASAYSNHDQAVVIVPTTHMSSAPRAARSATEKVVPIHEGTKVTIIDSVATPGDNASQYWYEVKLNNSTTAWLRASDVERI